jgi:prepilin-type N-terminal cleavage/methylation domain-containing protein
MNGTNQRCPRPHLVPTLRVGTFAADAPRRRGPPRRGVSLVEMIVVITVGSALVGIAVTMLAALMRAENRGQGRAAETASLIRLADQFRRDAHAATSLPAPDGQKAGTWKLDLAGGRSVEYAAEPGAIVRRERTVAKAVCEESFALPENYAATIASSNNAGQTTVTLVVAPAPGTAGAAWQWRVEAVLGRDHRFEAEAKRSK